ncbi:response regulator transcription factor [Pseudoblastomonas halimionae]|uniref:Response regulator n=1 Tax=Alteriqipengyuania halimionae TaxID=1926630 RepID=A0A6I4U2Z8_9SPHN|nr:response regulator [Alteriqipengyuania halimionae]MXP10400.1 response regulator [Alteriqipengyuania halimionae]
MARIILAEDDDIVGELVVNHLMDAGHAVGWLQNGDEALSVIRRKIPDLVILDHHMPERSGRDVLREMRKEEDLVLVPVLMLTAMSGKTDEDIAFYEGADDFMTKPFSPRDLEARVEALLKKSRRVLSQALAGRD